MNKPTVREVMVTDVLTVPLDMTYSDIAYLLARNKISAVPVVDDLRRLAGVVSEGDLLRRVEYLQEPEDATHILERPSRRTSRAKAQGAVARQLMTAPAITVAPDAGVADAARLMADKHIKQLPVVDRQGRMVGIVARRDLLRLFRRSDADIRTEITQSILERALHVPPDAVHVDVDDGAVTLTGAIHQSSKAQIAVRLTEAVPGVTTVVDRLTYDIDDEQNRAAPTEPYRQPAKYVVGVDGSDGSRHALRWAVAEAAAGGGSVLAVAAWHWEGDLAATVAADERRHLQALLAHEIDAVHARQQGVPITTEVVRGPTAQALTAAAAGADMLVLGQHGHSSALHKVLGSVTEACIRSAPCPVLVIPSGQQAAGHHQSERAKAQPAF
ncbi:CBS domain-containing protein [Catellatospora sp. NPDC049111]|uniref:CBS domain-containing protein n=1 Tax=Catellatospora sp. NPDC049111 TaxID=3155271 RepID=UPI0033F01AE0